MPESDFPEVDVNLDSIERFGREMRAIKTTAEDFSKVLTGGLKLAVRDGRDLDAIFKRLALNLSQRVLSRSLNGLESLLSNSLSAALGGSKGFAAGGIVPGGTASGAIQPFAQPFAMGGVVSRPSYFPLPQGGSGGGIGVMGEAGAEAILPLARGADGRLGVRSGSAAGAVTITFNISTPDAESFRRSEMQLSKMVARAAGRGRRGL